MIDDTQDPQDEDKRLRVLQALMAQRQGEGPYGALTQLAQAFTQNQTQNVAAENRENTRLGVKPVSPAYDDQGSVMPRAPGMARPTTWQAIQNFFAGGAG